MLIRHSANASLTKDMGAPAQNYSRIFLNGFQTNGAILIIARFQETLELLDKLLAFFGAQLVTLGLCDG